MKTQVKFIIFTALLFIFGISHADPADATLKILVTGFEPFGDYKRNPTNELVKYINGSARNEIENIELKAITFPVTYYTSWEMLEDEIELFKPTYLISFGYAPESHRVRIESTAKNHDRGYRDNNGKEHLGKIVADGPSSYSSELPILDIEKQLREKAIPVVLSSDAGGYLCNHIYYLERHFSDRKREIKSGFFHVPNWPISGQKGLWAVTKTIVSEIKKRHK